jgi:hypothetical protein
VQITPKPIQMRKPMQDEGNGRADAPLFAELWQIAALFMLLGFSLRDGFQLRGSWQKTTSCAEARRQLARESGGDGTFPRM